MGLCISNQGGEQDKKHSSTPRQSSKVEPVAKQLSILEDAIDGVEKNKESIENELEKLEQQLNETR